MNEIEYLTPPEQSINDKKEYRILRLQNQLTVLLVSECATGSSALEPQSCEDLASSSDSDGDSDSAGSDNDSSDSNETGSADSDDREDNCKGEKLAACALMVDVGSFSDPPDTQGLAHFLEHMIFMGSAKYPVENAFDSYISKCGGFDNANTDCEETSFYFEVRVKYLNNALDRFAHLFIAPLMKREAMARERESIESEFQSKMNDDEVRRDQLLALLGQDDHPSSGFSWGNLQTLKENISDDELYKRVHDFRTRHYSAHRMFLCVQARLPLKSIEEMVVENFSNITCNYLPADDLSRFTYKNAFKEDFYDRVYIMKPVSNICRLEVTWCLPSILNAYRTKPDEYVAYLIQNESRGSLCSFLRSKLWALELDAGVENSGFENNAIYSLFRITVDLTEEGFRHVYDILSVMFAYLKYLSVQGVKQDVFEELQSIEANTFKFQMEQSAFDNVQDLVLYLKLFPPEHVLNGSDLYFEYDSESIQKLLNHLNAEKFNILIASSNEFNGMRFDQKEKWFGTEYTSMKLPMEWAKLQGSNSLDGVFKLPPRNIFIAKDFSLKGNSSSELLSEYPCKVVDNAVCETWFRQDDKFLLPISSLYFYFKTPLVSVSPMNAILMQLYAMLLKYQIVEELYPATVAGLGYDCYPAEKGLVLKASGYNEKLHIIVDIITKRMPKFGSSVSFEHLAIFLKEQKRNFYNVFINPKSLNKDIRLSIIEHPRWCSYEKYNLLDTVNINEFHSFADNFIKELKLQILIQGNVTEKEAREISYSVLQNIGCSPINNPKSLEIRTRCLPYGSHFVGCKSFNVIDTNSVVTNFYQIGPSSIREECILDLLMMIVEEPLFDTLRTKEQLGYDVSASVRYNNGILGYSITVNSQEDKNPANYVESRIEAFRQGMLEILKKLPVEEFEHVQQTLIKTKLVLDDSLKDEVSRNWKEITSEEYIFGRDKIEAECIKQFTKKTIIDFCEEIEEQNFKKLSIQVTGNKGAQLVEPGSELDSDIKFIPEFMSEPMYIMDIQKFISSLALYDSKKNLLN